MFASSDACAGSVFSMGSKGENAPEAVSELGKSLFLELKLKLSSTSGQFRILE
jgi:hypothetical protein